jgi:hypothetical protein
MRLARFVPLAGFVRLARPVPLARLVPLAAFAAASLALAACDPGAGASPISTPSATPVVSHTVTPSPSAAPSPTATAVDPHPALDAMFITTSGVGPLTVGQAIVGNPGEAMVEWNATACDPEFATDPAALGRWQATYPEVPDHGRPFLVDGEMDGILRRIDVNSPILTTPEGIHQGSPVADLVAAYPGLTTGTAGWDSIRVHWIQDAHGTVVFETDTMNVDGTVGPDHVAFIRVLAAGIDPDWPVSQSSNIAGACF